jgi:hypothetical protein
VTILLLASIEYVHYLPTLRLFFDGGVWNDYRLKGNTVEFRTNEGPWRMLDDSDLAIHFRFDTEVARWLRRHSIEANPYGRSSW